VSAAERAVDAARAERLPYVSFNGDYGALDASPVQARSVFAFTGSVNLPVWTGGRIKADRRQAESALHQRQAELADQRGRVEQDPLRSDRVRNRHRTASAC
jgi:outer membrane protein TolC